MVIRLASPEDLPGILEILNREIREGYAHFSVESVTLAAIEQEFAQAGNLPWMVADQDCEILGFARANPWKSRGGYRHTCEVGVYVRPEAQGQSVGSRIYEAMIPELKARGFKTLLAGVALPNPASVRLHERFGFRQVGTLPQVGWKQGAWRDVGYWALTFDRPDPE
ncbi:MAG TPA: GNAT family N-acetyltransferase [Fimbriimonadaceae bacterium]|nr:GNAT family N-acetyltransferase [Fimbriimonadaceae bacterium]